MYAYLRKASENDMDLLYQWANDTDVRIHAFSTAEITYEEHQQWYRKVLADNQCQQYIYVCGDEEIGQVRLIINDDIAEIDYSIRKDSRCMGHGKMMLQLLAIQVKKDFPDVKRLTARVKPENIASQKAFLDIGYVEKYRYLELDVDKLRENRGQTDVPQ